MTTVDITTADFEKTVTDNDTRSHEADERCRRALDIACE